MDGTSSPGLARSLFLLLVVLLSSSVAFIEPCDLLYDQAVQAFYKGDYGGVVRSMEGALHSYAQVRRSKVGCRLRCEDQHPFDDDDAAAAAVAELRFFDVVLRRSACMNGCIEDKLGTQSMHRVSEDVVQDFHRRIPYNYLQLAYQKLKQPDKAAAAAHTYFQANPEHVEMGQNLEQYKDLQGVQEDHFVDREARPHQHSFSAGVRLYDQGDYEGAIVLFEEALEEYYKADVECRALCQGPQRFEGHNHLLYRYSLHELISVFRCTSLGFLENLVKRERCLSRKRWGCPSQTASEASGMDMFGRPFHLHGRLCREAGGFVVKAAWYLRRHKQELELLLIGSATMGVEFSEGQYWSSTGGREDSNRIPSGTDGWMEYVPISEKKNVSVMSPPQLREGGPLVYDSVRLVQNSIALNGTQRVLLDAVISEEECSDLKHLAHTVTMAGDGYRGKMSPHTPNERFEGATVLKTLQYGYEGRVPLRSARLFYDVSERARRIIESYFLLNSTLHFSYTHLVCRTAITGQQDHRNDLSHPIHADNCLLDPEANECWKEPPAYTYRDYSALLYLNGDFEGGEFIFTEMDAKTVTASVKPKCGRMVGFSSGGENPHGVKAVTGGQRCAVALWFTLNPLFRELERLQADEVIQALDSQAQSQWDHGLHINPKDEL
ncbi:prolyl 3-hydroxylase 2 [Lampris incognitus]|uniref:prolyl 3-hydroxylase 2 n=1 Tax=Lampris incognitus TaxID=2546036 RepID=UPI0024B5F70D|nr:prolyl 3-hydroxylase 2 [Lampris incognitus]